jgi:hypothetical protein
MIEILHGQLKNRPPARGQSLQDRLSDEGGKPGDAVNPI